jgi:hypothetical protein
MITGGVMMMGTFSTADTTLDQNGKVSQFNSTLNKASEIEASVGGIESSIEQAGSGRGPLGWLDAIVGSAYNGLKAIGNTMGFVQVAGQDAANIFNVPTIFVTLLSLIVTLIIGFAIWSAITKT